MYRGYFDYTRQINQTHPKFRSKAPINIGLHSGSRSHTDPEIIRFQFETFDVNLKPDPEILKFEILVSGFGRRKYKIIDCVIVF